MACIEAPSGTLLLLAKPGHSLLVRDMNSIPCVGAQYYCILFTYTYAKRQGMPFPSAMLWACCA
eukprot:scaffold232956_cov35-Tisochrysis_lutea.AAC.2